MTTGSPQDRGSEFFTAPEQVNHRRYEGLRAFFVEGLTHAQAAARFGYTRWTMVDLVRSTVAPIHRSYARPTYQPASPSPGRATAP